MAILHVRNVPEKLYSRLQRRAEMQRRSLSSEVITLLEKVSGVPAPRLSISYPLALGMAGIMELVSFVTGKPPLITRQSVRTLQHDIVPTSAKAQSQLGFSPRPLEETLRDEVNWFREHGYA